MANDQHPLLGALGLCRKAGKLLQHIPLTRVHRDLPAALDQIFRVTLDVARLHQQGYRFVACIQRTADHLGAFRDKNSLFRLQPIAKLCLGQTGKHIQLGCIQVLQFYDHCHA